MIYAGHLVGCSLHSMPAHAGRVSGRGATPRHGSKSSRKDSYRTPALTLERWAHRSSPQSLTKVAPGWTYAWKAAAARRRSARRSKIRTASHFFGILLQNLSTEVSRVTRSSTDRAMQRIANGATSGKCTCRRVLRRFYLQSLYAWREVALFYIRQ